jgi:uncharacterized protein (DUF433 family)
MRREGIHLSDPSIETSSEMIVSTPGTCGGKPRIAGHRIRVQDVVVLKEHMGLTLDEIVASYPSMTPEKIDAALEYYQAHREEIERDLKEEEKLADQLESGPNIVIVRTTGMVDAGTNPTSPR